MTVVVERRRRDKINTWISHLAELVPECSSDIKLTEVSRFNFCVVFAYMVLMSNAYQGSHSLCLSVFIM